MKPSTWVARDYEAGLKYLAGHEDEAQQSSVLEMAEGLTIVFPRGLPATGIHFVGAFMLAPVFLFMAILILLPVFGFMGEWPLGLRAVLITLGCILLFGGFIWVSKLMFKNRDLFPRKYFVTLSRSGIAMHFSRIQFPWRNPRTSIPYEEMKDPQIGRIIFWPAAIMGRPRVGAVLVSGAKSQSVLIPCGPIPGEPERVMEILKARIGQIRLLPAAPHSK